MAGITLAQRIVTLNTGSTGGVFGPAANLRRLLMIASGEYDELSEYEREHIDADTLLSFLEETSDLSSSIFTDTMPHLLEKLRVVIEDALRCGVIDPADILARLEEAYCLGAEIDPKERGIVLQEIWAKKYPTIRWHFLWGRYVVVGMTDGLTDDFVYEFKTTRARFMFRYVRPVAMAQADLYGMFFQRAEKRLELLSVEEGFLETISAPVNLEYAMETLRGFSAVEEGEPARPPKPWKCRSCEFRPSCPLVSG